MKRLVAIACLALLGACGDKRVAETPTPNSRSQAEALKNLAVTTSAEFAKTHGTQDSYWFSGLAELNRYELDQARYGEHHEGEAVLVFVTEPFLTDQQIKRDYGNDPAVQVLKSNHYRRFYTGVYPYTILTATYTPARDQAPTIKLTQSVQEWCGSFFAQLNLLADGSGFRGQSHSYFQSEGDQDFELGTPLLEDELYNRIRISPESLPTGDIELLPGSTYLRLAHQPWKARPAKATLSAPSSSQFSDRPVRTYKVDYGPSRQLDIHFEADFPYRIVAFEETYPALFNPKGGAPQPMRTTARLTNSIMLDYWNRHTPEDAIWRDALGLTQ